MLELILEHAEAIIAAVVGLGVGGLVAFVKSTPTKLDDKALEVLSQKLAEKLK